jgi:CYTH domain-containing protein
MAIVRRFLVAPPLARLVRKERSGGRITEGYFPNQSGRSSHVLLESDKGSLVLVTLSNGTPVEERTEVPRAHAAALLDVAAGKVDYARSRLAVAGRDICVDRFVTPGTLDLISVEFDSEDEAKGFQPLPWFGPEVTDELAYQNRSIAIEGPPRVPDVVVSNFALDSLLDALENRFRAPRAAPAPRPTGDAATAAITVRRPSPAGDGPVPAARDGQRPDASEKLSEVKTPAAGPSGLDLEVEDNVLRELARSLRPARR